MRSSLVDWRLKIGRVGLFLFSSFEAHSLIGERLLFDSTFHRVEGKIKGRERIKRYIKIWMGRLTLSRFVNPLAKIRGIIKRVSNGKALFRTRENLPRRGRWK